MKKVKPCPFCGGRARINFFGINAAFSVSCMKCDATQGRFDTEQRAIDVWNNRKGAELRERGALNGWWTQ